ncbi:MAG: efflux RND transporter periplasmic adaptor subunit, partial [Planctomycetota bacterium]
KVADADTFQGIKYNGIAQATREVDLSFRVGGPMIARPVKVGDNVKKGQLLARIDPRDYEVRLRNSKAQLARAKASLTAMRQARPEDIRRAQAKVNSSEAKMRLALANYNRVIRIRKADPGAVSQGMIDRALKDRDAAKAELRNSKEELRITKIGARKEDILAQESEIKALEATVARTKDDLSYTYLKAPFDGVITKTYVEAFEDVRPKQPLVRLLDPSKIEMWVNVPENLISLAPYVDKIWVRFDALGVEVPAAIKEIGTEASQTTRTFPVNLIMDQPKDAKILPGMAGVARYTLNMPQDTEASEFLIPVTAVFTDPDKQKSFVWLIDESALTISRHEIIPGKLTGRGLKVKGLQPGQWIAVAGVDLLRDGQKVTILESGKRR